MGARIKRLEVDDFYRWDRFVLDMEASTFFHLTRWQDVLRLNFHHVPLYLYRERDGEISGILPLVQVRSPFLGTVLVSIPHAVYGGIVAREGEDEEALLEAAKALAFRLEARYVEFRNLHASHQDLPASDLYYTFIREIPDSEDGCLAMLPRKARAAARHGRDKFKLRFREAPEAIDRFYELFVLNKRHLGSPVFARKYFRSLMDILDGQVHIHAVEHEGRMVCAVMSFVFKDVLLPYYSGSDKRYERMNTNNFMYWQLMAWAGKQGLGRFDFGRSRKETGPFHFKKNMGFEPLPLDYRYFFPAEARLPSLNPSNPKFDLPKRIMQHLPLPMAKLVGPLIIRHIP